MGNLGRRQDEIDFQKSNRLLQVLENFCEQLDLILSIQKQDDNLLFEKYFNSESSIL